MGDHDAHIAAPHVGQPSCCMISLTTTHYCHVEDTPVTETSTVEFNAFVCHPVEGGVRQSGDGAAVSDSDGKWCHSINARLLSRVHYRSTFSLLFYK